MALVTTEQVNVFDTSLIKKGDLIYVEYENWNEPKKGMVIHVSAEKLVVLYHPNIANVTNRQELLASEVAGGGYTVRWSSDLITVSEYSSVEEGEDNDP